MASTTSGCTRGRYTKSSTAADPISRPAASDSSTSAVSPPISTRYFPGCTVPARMVSMGARLTMASAA